MSAVRKSKRLNGKRPARTSDGSFNRKCGASTHDLLNDDDSVIDLVKRPKLKYEEYSLLIQSGIVADDTKYICKSCYTKFKQMEFKQQLKRNNDMTESNSSSSEIEEDGDDNEEIISSCISIGKDLNLFLMIVQSGTIIGNSIQLNN